MRLGGRAHFGGTGEPARNMGLRAPLLSALAWAGFLALWEISAKMSLFNPILFPGPSAVAQALFAWVREGIFFLDVEASLKRVALGWLLGGAFGIVLGLLSGRLAWAAVTFGRIVNTLRAVPPVALVPLAILWFGISESSKVFLVAWGAFFPVWLNTHLGVSNLNKSIEWAARSLGVTGYRFIVKVILPAAVPSIVAGLRLAIGIAYICVFVGELAGAFQGVGFRIATASLVFRADLMMAGLIALGVMGAASDAAFLAVIRRLLPWLANSRGH
jgi:ABC-type nitrate/sulfonate/bicarbonate transport system permease component